MNEDQQPSYFDFLQKFALRLMVLAGATLLFGMRGLIIASVFFVVLALMRTRLKGLYDDPADWWKKGGRD